MRSGDLEGNWRRPDCSTATAEGRGHRRAGAGPNGTAPASSLRRPAGSLA